MFVVDYTCHEIESQLLAKEIAFHHRMCEFYAPLAALHGPASVAARALARHTSLATYLDNLNESTVPHLGQR